MIFKSRRLNIYVLHIIALYCIWQKLCDTDLFEVYKWIHTPGITRPARPLLCMAFARDTQRVSKLSIFWFELNLVSFIIPTSITKTQSSIVIDVSAKFVLITILRTSFSVFLNIRLCSSLDKLECKGKMRNLVFGHLFPFSHNWLHKVRISAKPGKNI